MDKYTGKRLDGRYEIHELIGSGGMALVYRAYDEIDDRTVAIKILKDEFLGNDEFIRRFKNESKAIAVLSHPNIVKVFDVSFGDRIQYIVEEYIDGITLKEYLDQQKEIKWKEAIHFTIQILRALQHAHEKGIVHRDIKPQNIMLLQDGTIKVTDFGIARFSRSETRTMTDKAIGSVHYIAPEQARGDLTDEKADIYSVGVMLYEMITGQLPFEADSAVSVAIMQLQADPKPPKEINPGIPDGLEEITLKAMQKNPVQRYQSAAEMLRDIEEFRRNPSIRFQYKYFIDEKPTKYIDAINTVRGAEQPVYNDNYEYEEEPVRNPKKKKKSTASLVISGIAAAFVIVAIGFGLAALFHSCNSSANDVPLPNFVGKTYDEVKSDPQYKNFKFVTETKNDTTQKAGIILSQNPPAGTMVKPDTEVTLTINAGGKMVTIPDLTKNTQDEAISILKQLNLTYEILPVEDTNVIKGYVQNTDPPAGTQVSEGTKVSVYVSTGGKTEKVAVPAVIDETLEAAKKDILAAGLVVGKITTKDDTNKAKDIVIETSPLPGVQVAKGSSVSIIVSSGKKSEKTIEIYVHLPKNVTHDINLKVYLGNELQTEKTVNPSYNDVCPLTFTGSSGQKKLTIQLDGNKYQVYTLDFSEGTFKQEESYPYTENNSSSESVSGPITPAD
ncbi:Stk1 family PASTA domain-containing Ser/Thr kinase [Caproiciproducens galactitolivorans]|uniref:non-specific serine/threonine protein kinase n=1 Tax=Caproiciproducens galactitolivorans TaxID=642589 RepID=A0A4Z0YC67_9FIRM|nr:Stk1 family PASTA domain-containing Ser/Thr kinase [Caproiciproducens galactitolivorans]QEY34038.1 Stk1 family PASTA domain-containing Ser/Thr kinase [Caproiciproducens galactitolivorans]TGJ76550.1 serine/threonine-protein kinase PrkC [Caproiciproducens galactitolivorans]